MENETKLRQQRKKNEYAAEKEKKLPSESTKKQPVEADSAPTEDKKIRSWFWMPTRWFPIWLRVILVVALVGAAAMVGAMIGYGIVGEGGDMFEIFNPDTWYHIYDIIYDNVG